MTFHLIIKYSRCSITKSWLVYQGAAVCGSLYHFQTKINFKQIYRICFLFFLAHIANWLRCFFSSWQCKRNDCSSYYSRVTIQGLWVVEMIISHHHHLRHFLELELVSSYTKLSQISGIPFIGFPAFCENNISWLFWGWIFQIPWY